MGEGRGCGYSKHSYSKQWPSSWEPSPPPPIQMLRLQGRFVFLFFKAGISQPLGDAAPRLQGLRIVQNLKCTMKSLPPVAEGTKPRLGNLPVEIHVSCSGVQVPWLWSTEQPRPGLRDPRGTPVAQS